MGGSGAGGARHLRRGAAGPRGRGPLPADLLTEVLELPQARAELTEAVLADPRLGDSLRRRVADYLGYLDPAGLASVLVAGLAHEELRSHLGPDREGGLVYTLMDTHDFVIDPLPNLLFTRDSSVWIRDHAAVTSLAHAGAAPGDAPSPTRSTATTRGSPARRCCTSRRLEHARGRRRAAARAGRAGGRGRRADHPGRRRAAGPPGASRRPRAYRAGGADRPGARHHAPGHGLHDGRPRRGGDVPEHRRLTDRLSGHPRRRRASRWSGDPRRSWRRRPRRWASTGCG